MGQVAAQLRERVYRANQELAGSGLVHGTFGNVSGVDREAGLFVIKASGVPYEEQTPDHMVPVSLETGEVVDGPFRPSSDSPTHLELYRFVLRRNHTMYGARFSLGPDGDLYLVGRVALEHLTVEELDRIIGVLYELTETWFQPIVRIAYRRPSS